MSARNTLLTAPPYAVEQACRTLGANLRTARVRRGLSIAQAAEHIGTGPRAVMDAEKGKFSTGLAVYVALLWLYDLAGSFTELADPLEDAEGLAHARAEERQRPSRKSGLNDDF
jgi:transcriptional regulator with XRE-family HTH domain